MANPEQLEYLQDTAEDWNIYRHEHAITHPDLSGADLPAAQLPGADLSIADLRAADLTGSNLANANLTEANLGGAFLLHVDLSGANLVMTQKSGSFPFFGSITSSTLSLIPSITGCAGSSAFHSQIRHLSRCQNYGALQAA